MPRPPLFPLLRLAAAVSVGVALIWSLSQPPPVPASTPAPASDVPIAYTVTLGQDGGTNPVDVPVPSKPFPGQVIRCRPKVHTAINGGCWRKLADAPPCEESYLWRGDCYVPDMMVQRPHTSIHP